MYRFLIICSLLISVFNCHGQIKEELWANKYGNDKNNWPVWTPSPEAMSNGMNLDVIDLDSLLYNNKTLTYKSDEAFEVLDQPGNLPTRIQDGLTYLFINSKWNFSGTFLSPEDLVPIQAKVSYNGRSLNDIQSIKTHFNSSFSWRDAYANMLHGYVDKKEWNNLTLVLLGVNGSKDVLQLFYFEEKLVFVHREINSV